MGYALVITAIVLFIAIVAYVARKNSDEGMM